MADQGDDKGRGAPYFTKGPKGEKKNSIKIFTPIPYAHCTFRIPVTMESGFTTSKDQNTLGTMFRSVIF